jgi:hypothetical protein
VKCDEGKPGCLRCKKTNKRCGGYDVPKTWIFDPYRDDDSTDRKGQEKSRAPKNTLGDSPPTTGSWPGENLAVGSPGYVQYLLKNYSGERRDHMSLLFHYSELPDQALQESDALRISNNPLRPCLHLAFVFRFD